MAGWTAALPSIRAETCRLGPYTLVSASSVSRRSPWAGEILSRSEMSQEYQYLSGSNFGKRWYQRLPCFEIVVRPARHCQGL
jgi:hypothetical protein